MSAGSHTMRVRPMAPACGSLWSSLTEETSFLRGTSQIGYRRIQNIALEGQSLLMHDRIESQPNGHQHHCNELQTGSEQRQWHVVYVPVLQPVANDRYATCDSGQDKHQRQPEEKLQRTVMTQDLGDGPEHLRAV